MGKKTNQREIVANHHLGDFKPLPEQQEEEAVSWVIPMALCGKLQEVAELLPSFCPSLPALPTDTDVATDLLCLPEHQGLKEG